MVIDTARGRGTLDANKRYDVLCLLGYHALSMKHDKPTEDAVTVTEERRQFDLPELLHNLDLLVEMAESEVIHNDKK